MRTLVWDTETTGKADFKRKNELMIQPFVVQIAGILFDDGRPLAHYSAVTIPEFKGERQPISAEVAAIHGISDAVVDAVGIPYNIALASFNQLVKRSDRMVAHNVEFDDLVTRASYSRIAAPQDALVSAPKFCTMKGITDVLKIPGKYGNKFPSLDEAYRALVDPAGFDGAHDAMVDVVACAKVLWAIEAKGYPLKRLN